MSEEFEIRFSEQGAKEVVRAMREMNAAAGEAVQKTEQLSDSLARVKTKADPAQHAYEQLAKNLDILGRSQQANLITSGQQERMGANLIRSTEAQIRPFSSLISNIQRETQAWTQNRTAREASLNSMRAQQALQVKGISLNAEEIASLNETYLALQRQKEATLEAEAAERRRAVEAVAAAKRAEAAIVAENRARERAASLVAGVVGRTRAETAGLTAGPQTEAQIANLKTAQQLASLQRAGIKLTEDQKAQIAEVNLEYAKQKTIVTEINRAKSVQNLIDKTQAETAALGAAETPLKAAGLRTAQQIAGLQRAGIELNDAEIAQLEKVNLEYATQRDRLSEIARVKRELSQVQNIGGNPVADARNRFNNASNTVNRAAQLGIIGGAEAAQLQQQLDKALNEQINPLERTKRLLLERSTAQEGLFNSGRALAQVERDITRAQELGITASNAELTSLRARAIEIDKVERAYAHLNSIKGIFNSTVGGIGLLFGGEAIVHSLDTIQNIQNLLSVTSKGSGNQAAVTTQVFDVARETHSTVEDTAKLYSRLNLSLEKFGFGQKQVLDLTKEVNQQIRLSGTSQGEATRAVLDFAHAISSGNVQFRELRAITSQAPFVAKSIAEGLTKLAEADAGFRKRVEAAGVNLSKGIGVGDLKELTSKRAIGSGDIVKAEQLQAEDTANAFRKLSPTISQALTDVHTEFLRFINDFNNSTGAARGLSSVIEFVADNLKTIIPIGVELGAVMLGIFVKNRIEDVTTLISTFAKTFTKAKVVTTEASLATDANTTAIATNSTQLEIQNGLLAANAKEFDLSTAAIARNAAVREEANLVKPSAPGLIGGKGRFIKAAAAETEEAAGVGAVAAEGEAAAVGVAATEAAGAGLLGTLTAGAGVLATGVGALVTGLGIALPLIIAAGTAWLLLKDSVNLAKDATILYSDGGVTKAMKGTVTLGDVASGAFDLITGKVSDLTKTQTDGAQKAAAASVKGAQDSSKAQEDAANALLKSNTDAFDKTHSAYDQLQSGMLKSTISFVADAVSIFKTFGLGIESVFAAAKYGILGFFQDIQNAFILMYNSTIVPALNAGKSVGIGQGAEPLKLKTYADEYKTKANQNLDQQYRDIQNSNLKNKEELTRLVEQAAGNRQRSRGNITDSAGEEDLAGGGKKKKAKKDPVESAYEELTKATFPAIEAIHKFNDAMDNLNKAAQKGYVQKLADEINAYDKKNHANVANTSDGQITADLLKNRQAEVARRELEDVIDPSRAFVRKNQEKIDFLGGAGQQFGAPDVTKLDKSILEKTDAEITSEEQRLKLLPGQLDSEAQARIKASVQASVYAEEIARVNVALNDQRREQSFTLSQMGESKDLIKAQADAYKLYKDALEQHIPGAKAAYDTAVQSNLAYEQMEAVVSKVNAAYQKLTDPLKNFNDELKAQNILLAEGKESFDQYEKSVRNANKALLETKTDGMSGFKEAMIDIKNEAENTAADIKSVFTDAYSNIQSGFQDLFTKGFSPKTLRESLLKITQGVTNDLSKALFHKLTDPLVNSIGQKFGIPGIGDNKDKAIQAARVDLQAASIYLNGQVISSAIGGQLPSIPGLPAANDNNGGLFGNVQIPGFGASAPTAGIPNLLGAPVATSTASGGGLFSGIGSLFSGLQSGVGSLFKGFGAAGGATGLVGSAGSFGSLLGPIGTIGGSLLGGLFGGGQKSGSPASSQAPIPVFVTNSANDNNSSGGLLGGNSSGGLLGGLLGGSSSGGINGLASGNPLGLFSGLAGASGGASALGGGNPLGLFAGLAGAGSSSAGGLGGLMGLLGGASGGAGGAGGLLSLLGGGAGAAAGGSTAISSLLQFLPLLGFATGGSFDVPGHGGTDSKFVGFKATPGENVTVTTPAQQKAAKDGGNSPTINQKIVNVIDPSAMLDAMQSHQGEHVLMNFIQSNPEAIKRALGG